jgi:hypothetical protein
LSFYSLGTVPRRELRPAAVVAEAAAEGASLEEELQDLNAIAVAKLGISLVRAPRLPEPPAEMEAEAEAEATVEEEATEGVDSTNRRLGANIPDPLRNISEAKFSSIPVLPATLAVV